MKKLPLCFYQRENVLQIARELLGKVLVTNWNGKLCSGRIVEVEAYRGVTDKASHAYGGRRTERNEIMYANGGVAYVYLCYGIHHLFNVVTHNKGTPHAILIRALEPVKGMDTMLYRSGRRNTGSFQPEQKNRMYHLLMKGPGKLSRAMGIFTKHSGCSLRSKELFIGDDGFVVSKKDIAASRRIGVDYAGEDAKLPYRFFIKGNASVSGKTK